MAVTIDSLVAIHRKMEKAMSEYQAKIDEIDEQRLVVRSTILEMMKEQKLESVRTDEGTVTKGVKDRYWSNDWAALSKYIAEHGAIGLLQQRIHETNMREWIAAHPNDFPPSLNVDREYGITIRKPTTKKEL
jgi:hypothetical protein